MVPGRAGQAEPLGTGKRTPAIQSCISKCVSEFRQAGLTLEFTPQAPGSGTGFSAPTWHTSGGGPRRPGAERAV